MMGFKRLAGLAAGAFVLAALATSAQAGRAILVDQSDNYLGDGQNWPTNTNFFVDETTSNFGTIPFALNFGDGLGAVNHKFSFDLHGQATFLDASNASTGQYIAPLLSKTPFQSDSGSGGFMLFGSGFIDPQLLVPAVPNPVYDKANQLTAYRFLWNTVCPADQSCDFSNDIRFEAVIVDRSAGNAIGDFDLDFFYSTASGFVPADGTGGFSLGGSTTSFTQFTDPGPDFCFRGGVNTPCSRTTTPVPEPETLPLFIGGIAVLAGLRQRKRKASALATA